MNRRYRKTIIAGNWKMNNTLSQMKAFAEQIKPIIPKGKWCNVVLCVPAVNITSAVRLTECAINDVLGLEAAVKVRDKDASITLKLPSTLGQTNESTCQALLTALMVHFVQLAEEYPDYISVLEV